MEEKDIQKLIQLVHEGGNFKQIYNEQFESRYQWSEVLAVINQYNLKTALGAKQTITKNLNKLELSATPQQKELIAETRELVEFIYTMYKEAKKN